MPKTSYLFFTHLTTFSFLKGMHLVEETNGNTKKGQPAKIMKSPANYSIIFMALLSFSKLLLKMRRKAKKTSPKRMFLDAFFVCGSVFFASNFEKTGSPMKRVLQFTSFLNVFGVCSFRVFSVSFLARSRPFKKREGRLVCQK